MESQDDSIFELNYTWRIFKHLTAPLGQRHIDPYRLEIVDMLIDYQDVIGKANNKSENVPPWYRRRAATMTKLILHPDFRDDLWALWMCTDASTGRYATEIQKYFIDSYKIDNEIAKIFTKFVCGESYRILNPFNPPLREISQDEIMNARADFGSKVLIQIDEDGTVEDVNWLLKKHKRIRRSDKRQQSKAMQYSTRDMAIYIMRKRKLNLAQIDLRLTQYGIEAAKNDKTLNDYTVYKIVERLKPKSKAMLEVRKQIAEEGGAFQKIHRNLELDSKTLHFIIRYSTAS